MPAEIVTLEEKPKLRRCVRFKGFALSDLAILDRAIAEYNLSVNDKTDSGMTVNKIYNPSKEEKDLEFNLGVGTFLDRLQRTHRNGVLRVMADQGIDAIRRAPPAEPAEEVVEAAEAAPAPRRPTR